MAGPIRSDPGSAPGAERPHGPKLKRDPRTGVCVMQMDAGLDTGPVAMREELPIGPDHPKYASWLPSR